MWQILAALDHPERRLPPTIHIAGTNGKGSTLAFLRALGEVAGLRVHAYISPHLIRFNERIELAGQAIGDDALSEILDRAERANDGAAITFFEITTAAALTAFADTPADLLILETGLGGRLDSTNVLAHPMAHVITPISIDHQRFLGDDLATIADAKAGILRPGVPAVIGPQPPAAARVIAAEAAKLGAPLFRHGAEWAVAAASSTENRGGFQFTWHDQAYDLPAPALAGGHQYLNAGAALAAAHVVNALPAGHRPRFDLRPAAVAEALATVRWPGRLQKLSHGPLTAGLPAGAEVWLDGGHNAGGAAVLAAQISRMVGGDAETAGDAGLWQFEQPSPRRFLRRPDGPEPGGPDGHHSKSGKRPSGGRDRRAPRRRRHRRRGRHERVNGRAQPHGHPSAGTGFDLRLALSGRPCAGRKQLSAGMKKRRPKGRRF